MRITSPIPPRITGVVVILVAFCAISLFGRQDFTSKLNDQARGVFPESALPPPSNSATTALLAQFSQQGPKFVGTGAVASFQGHSVSVSGDGNTAIVGGTDNSNAGAAWVWTRSGGVWSQQGPKLVGSGALGSNNGKPSSVSVSADGNTAIVGGPGDNGNAGAAWVWTRSGGVWTQEGDKLVGSDAVENFFQGASVSLSADGNTAIVGGPGFIGTNAGAAWVWTRSGGVWTQEGGKLVGSDAVGNANQGASVSLSADGKYRSLEKRTRF